MRYHVFLVEYNRNIEATKLAPKLIMALVRDTSMFGSTEAEQAVRRGRRTLTAGMRVLPIGSTQPERTLDQQFPEVSSDERQQIATDLLRAIEEKDPTPQKMYMQWLGRMYSLRNVKFEDLNRRGLLTRYHQYKLKRKLKPEHADINRFKSYADFEAVVDDNYPELDDTATDNERGKYEEIHNDATVRVIIPQSQQAACFWGLGTKWCTAATKGDNMFDGYNSEGTLFIFLPKQPKHTGEKYQLFVPEQYTPHWEDSGGAQLQFMDEKDDEASLFELNDRFPEAVGAVMSHVMEKDYYPFSYHVAFMDDDADHIGERLEEITDYVRDALEKVISFHEKDDDLDQDELIAVQQALDATLDMSIRDLQQVAREVPAARKYYYGGYGDADNDAIRNGTADVDTVLPTLYVRAFRARIDADPPVQPSVKQAVEDIVDLFSSTRHRR